MFMGEIECSECNTRSDLSEWTHHKRRCQGPTTDKDGYEINVPQFLQKNERLEGKVRQLEEKSSQLEIETYELNEKVKRLNKMCKSRPLEESESE